MASFRLELKRSAEQDIRRIPAIQTSRLLWRIERLVDEPRPRQSVKLTGTENLYRLRVGDYRVIYEIDEPGATIVIYYVRHRREAYRSL